MDRPLFVVLAAAVLVTPLPVAGQEITTGPTFRFDEEVRSGDWLRVHTVHGDIDVLPADGPRAQVVGETRGDEDQIVYELVRDADGVTICALRPEASTCDKDGIDSRGGGWFRRNRASANLVVRVPNGVHLRVGSGNGEVDVDGASGEVIAGSGNGDVTVIGSGGPVRAGSGNGEIIVESVAGPVDASTGNGRVSVNTALGPVSASTGNGSIHVRMERMGPSGDLDFSTGNGSILIELPADFEAELVARLGHGGIESDFPIRITRAGQGGRWEGVIGEGGATIRASSGNGHVELRRIPR